MTLPAADRGSIAFPRAPRIACRSADRALFGVVPGNITRRADARRWSRGGTLARELLFPMAATVSDDRDFPDAFDEARRSGTVSVIQLRIDPEQVFVGDE